VTTWADIHSAQFRYTAKRWGVNWESNADGDPFLDPAEYSTWVLPKYYAEEVARFWDRALAEWDRDQYDYLGTHLEAAIDKYRIARTTALEGPTELDPAIPGEPVIVPRNAGPFWAASGELAVWLDATDYVSYLGCKGSLAIEIPEVGGVPILRWDWKAMGWKFTTGGTRPAR